LKFSPATGPKWEGFHGIRQSGGKCVGKLRMWGIMEENFGYFLSNYPFLTRGE
jgi:hypothetical protein